MSRPYRVMLGTRDGGELTWHGDYRTADDAEAGARQALDRTIAGTSLIVYTWAIVSHRDTGEQLKHLALDAELRTITVTAGAAPTA